MPKRPPRAALRATLLYTGLLAAPTIAAQIITAPAPALTTVAPYNRPDLDAIPVIAQTVRPSKPLTVTGARGAILGDQSGVVELWQLPVKVFSNLHLRAELDGYTVPLELNPGAATVEVRPGHTILTYSFAGITVRQHMLVSPAQPYKVIEDPGALLYFEIDAVRPATLTVTLTPAMQQEWPAPQYGNPNSSWTQMGEGGAYIVSTDNPALFGMVGMPNSRPGHLPVYQEHPQTLPLEFLVRYDPARDKGRLFPLLSTVSHPGERNGAPAQLAMQQRLADQARNLPDIAHAIDSYYAHFFDIRLTAHTPDPEFDKALRWAELSIEDSQVEHRSQPAPTTAPAPTPAPTCHPNTNCTILDLPVNDRHFHPLQTETGLVAGWFPSYDSTRPGFGWYFGRDTLWSLYAIDSYGDTALGKRALEFILHRQRADGKVMHEFSQMADDLPPNMAWSTFGYEYAAADATPLLLLAVRDYVRTSGDTAFLAAHWDQLKQAYRYERTHDSDGDGVYDNSNGTGWVENWQSPMPHQELYLASLDLQATEAVVELARLQHDIDLSNQAAETAGKLVTAVEQYRDPKSGLYAFSKNADGTYDRTLTVYPAVALWNPPQAIVPALSNGGACTGAAAVPTPSFCVRPGLAHPEAMLQAWSSPAMATDWGTRALATSVPFYDPISYHMGSVWPLFTGWNAMAQYRTGHPTAAWITLQQNLRLTFAEDPGTVTELLSGQFYQPLGRSSAHQLWSSAMVLAPALRGLFGVESNAQTNTLQLHPNLPIAWDHAILDNVRVGDTFYRLGFNRQNSAGAPKLIVDIHPERNGAIPPNAHAVIPCTASVAGYASCALDPGGMAQATLPLPAVEFALHAPAAPQPGDETHLPHITGERYLPDRTEFDLEAQANTTVLLDVRRNGTLDHEPFRIAMPAGTGYVTRHIILTATR